MASLRTGKSVGRGRPPQPAKRKRGAPKPKSKGLARGAANAKAAAFPAKGPAELAEELDAEASLAAGFAPPTPRRRSPRIAARVVEPVLSPQIAAAAKMAGIAVGKAGSPALKERMEARLAAKKASAVSSSKAPTPPPTPPPTPLPPPTPRAPQPLGAGGPAKSDGVGMARRPKVAAAPAPDSVGQAISRGFIPGGGRRNMPRRPRDGPTWASYPGYETPRLRPRADPDAPVAADELKQTSLQIPKAKANMKVSKKERDVQRQAARAAAAAARAEAAGARAEEAAADAGALADGSLGEAGAVIPSKDIDDNLPDSNWYDIRRERCRALARRAATTECLWRQSKKTRTGEVFLRREEWWMQTMQHRENVIRHQWQQDVDEVRDNWRREVDGMRGVIQEEVDGVRDQWRSDVDNLKGKLQELEVEVGQERERSAELTADRDTALRERNVMERKAARIEGLAPTPSKQRPEWGHAEQQQPQQQQRLLSPRQATLSPPAVPPSWPEYEAMPEVPNFRQLEVPAVDASAQQFRTTPVLAAAEEYDEGEEEDEEGAGDGKRKSVVKGNKVPMGPPPTASPPPPSQRSFRARPVPMASPSPLLAPESPALVPTPGSRMMSTPQVPTMLTPRSAAPGTPGTPGRTPTHDMALRSREPVPSMRRVAKAKATALSGDGDRLRPMPKAHTSAVLRSVPRGPPGRRMPGRPAKKTWKSPKLRSPAPAPAPRSPGPGGRRSHMAKAPMAKAPVPKVPAVRSRDEVPGRSPDMRGDQRGVLAAPLERSEARNAALAAPGGTKRGKDMGGGKTVVEFVGAPVSMARGARGQPPQAFHDRKSPWLQGEAKGMMTRARARAAAPAR